MKYVQLNQQMQMEQSLKNNIFSHNDAVQSIGIIKFDVQKLKIDSLSISKHKIYSPKNFM